jgi:uncharacterized membrane protein
MHWESILLLVVIALGGAAVIGSYVVGLRGKAEAFWGGVPARIRPIYGVSMVLSAAGFLAALYYIFFKLTPEDVVIGGRLGFAVFFLIFAAILLPSALWVPLSQRYLKRPSTGSWAFVRTVLFLVGLASIALAWVFFALKVDEHGVAYWLATGGSCYFAFHTFVLDALLWAALFRRPQPGTLG